MTSILRIFVAITALSLATPFAGAQEVTTRLNPNTAAVDELASLDSFPLDLANRVLAERPFARTSEFDALVSGFAEGDAKTAIYEVLFLPIDLNTATAAEIALIPGMTRRMIHEFEEYRPYTSIDQFNREIGKYVDKDEVARLRSYVTLAN